MKLLIKQRVFSWTDKYDIYDEDGNVRYFVKGEFFSLGHRLHIYDADENEVGLVRQKLMTILPVFELEEDGRVIGRVERRFSMFKPKYDVDFRGWRAEGDFCSGSTRYGRRAAWSCASPERYFPGAIHMCWT